VRTRRSLFSTELADNLAAHATIEEKIFYPPAYAKQTKEMLTEAVEEDLAMKRLIADLLDLLPEHDNFDAKVKVLKEQVEHHVEEEESELLEAARKDMGAAELDTLGTAMKQLFDAQMDESPSDAVPEQTLEAAPMR